MSGVATEYLASINATAKRATGAERDFFRVCSLTQSASDCAELRFLRSVLFYFALLFECGGKPVRFCINQSQFTDSVSNDAEASMKTIHALRTQAAHSLEDGPHDRGLRLIAKYWFRKQTQQDFPTSEEDWRTCADEIEKLGMTILDGIKRFISPLESDPEMDRMKLELRQSMEGGLRRAEIEELVDQVLKTQGRMDLRPDKICERFLSEWTKTLSLKSIGSDVHSAVLTMIESTIGQIPEPPPISTEEIIDALQLQPGPIIASVVRERDRLVKDGVKDRSDLIAKLKEHVTAVNSQVSDSN